MFDEWVRLFTRELCRLPIVVEDDEGVLIYTFVGVDEAAVLYLIRKAKIPSHVVQITTSSVVLMRV